MCDMTKFFEKVKPGWAIPIVTKELFVNFCDDVGSTVQEDFAGSLLLWTKLPANIRELIKKEAKGILPADKDFWNGLSLLISASVQAHEENRKEPPEKKRSKSD